MQIKINWKNGVPNVTVKGFKVREDSQGFPNVFKELSSYLIADYLLVMKMKFYAEYKLVNGKKEIK